MKKPHNTNSVKHYEPVSLLSQFSDADPKTVAKALEQYFRQIDSNYEAPSRTALSLAGAVLENSTPVPINILLRHVGYFRDNLNKAYKDTGSKYFSDLEKALGRAESYQDILDLLSQQAYVQAMLIDDLKICWYLSGSLEVACGHIEVAPFESLSSLCSVVASQIDPELQGYAIVE